MKRYWLFIGQNYYPSGAMRDFIRGFDRFDEVTDFLASGTWTEDDEAPQRFDRKHMWWEVLDTVELKVLRPFGGWTDVKER